VKHCENKKYVKEKNRKLFLSKFGDVFLGAVVHWPSPMPQVPKFLGSNPRKGVGCSEHTLQCCYLRDIICSVIVLNYEK
jgi:hypothetical protein